MYCAFGFVARYPTILDASEIAQLPSPLNDVQLLNRGVTRLDVFNTPEGLMIARSGAGSPLRFESMPLNTVASSPDSKASVAAILTPPKTDRAKWFELFLKNGRS